MNPMSLNLSTDNLFQILDNLSDVVILSNQEGRVIWMNKYICDLLGDSARKWMNKTTQDLINDGQITQSLANIKTNKTQTGFILTKNGNEFMSIVRPIYDDKNNVKFYLSTSMVLQELTKLKEQLEKLRRQHRRYDREIKCLRDILFLDQDIVFESAAMELLVSNALKIAQFDSTVLITGESGVGKEVLAKTIHKNSKRKSGPFIPVVISSIPENLLEAELFGYTEGSFTGAVRGGKVGLFESAQGGTLFLDEIGDCPYDIQVKILRVLENNEIRKVGETRNIQLNVRIIAATNKNLPQMVEQGLFREDLFYRLNVLPLYIKPLRERAEDIEPLCEFFLEKINNKYNLNRFFSPSALENLKNYKWYGNVRELKNIVERLSILSESDNISSDNVNAILNSTAESPPISNNNGSKNNSTWDKYISFEQSEILETLKRVGGNKSKAAISLGISRSKLYRKLKDNKNYS